MAENLWGEISLETTIRPPVTILKEQASFLSDSTNKILQGIVQSLKYSNEQIVGYRFSIFAPALQNFQYKILEIRHSPVLVYPVTVISEDPVLGTAAYDCADEETFVLRLKEILSSDTVHKAISSMISQSKAGEE
jgi:hypothetical protein